MVLEASSPVVAAMPIESQKTDFRCYNEDPGNDPIQERVKQHYYAQHEYQTVDFVRASHEKWLKFTHGKLTIMECLELLNKFLDHSDPDVDQVNIFHGYQTAESLRLAVPDKPWMHLAGLIHDMGKVMAVWGEPQWAITGDTYPVGCMPADSIVYGIKSFGNNPDLKDPRYNTKLGMYKEGCGLENLLMTWTHDEYLYQVLKNHPQCTLPDEALYAIRFHSFYPYHASNDYLYFQNERDVKMRWCIEELNRSDLYSKGDNQPDIAKLKPYYQSLVDKYIPGVLAW